MPRTSTMDRLHTELTSALGFDPIEGNMSPDGTESGPNGRRYYWVSAYRISEAGKISQDQLRELSNLTGRPNYSHVTMGSKAESGTVRQLTRVLAMVHAHSVMA